MVLTVDRAMAHTVTCGPWNRRREKMSVSVCVVMITVRKKVSQLVNWKKPGVCERGAREERRATGSAGEKQLT